MAGCVASSMTAANRALGPGAPARPATKAAVKDDRLPAFDPYHVLTAAAAHEADLSAWHAAQAFGVPNATLSSGRGTLNA
jgi:hypothetical protein